MHEQLWTRPRRGRGASIAVASLLSIPSLFAQVPMYTFSGMHEFGNDLDSLGDVDGDGCDDFAIGIPRDPTVGTDAGKIEVRSGKTGAVLYSMLGSGPEDQFGARVVAAGDANLDGVPDVLGASLESSATALAGYVRLHSGANGALLKTFVQVQPQGDIGFGRALAGGEDVNGDGRTDVAIGAFVSNVVYVMSGANGSVLRKFKPATTGDDAFGSSVDFADDLDHDHSADVLIGAPSGNYAEIRSTGSGASLQTWTGATQGEHFGAWVTRLGDLDGDGHDDVGIGAPLANANGPSAGYAVAKSALGGGEIHRADGLGGYEYGSRIEGAGDVDGDGVADFLVGTPYGDIALLYSGATGGTIAAFPGDELSYGYGGVLAGGGDVDGDGVPNVIVGSTGHPLSMPLMLQVKVFKKITGGFEWSGDGCPAPTGIAPRLDGSGIPKSNGWLALRVSGTNKPTPAMIVMGPGLTNVPIGNGCPLLVSGMAVSPITLVLQPQTLGSGEKTAFFPLPIGTPSGQIWLQALLPESGSVATTNAMRVTVE